MDLRKVQRVEAARLISARRRAPHPSGLLDLAPDPALEEIADGWLDEDRRQRPHGGEILSYEQLERRRQREVQAGLRPDPAFYSGLYHRAYNPRLGDRPKSYPHTGDRWGNPEFDGRVSSRGGAGWTDIWVTRDRYAHDDPLTHGQRRRIRMLMRRVPPEKRRLARVTLAMMFGVSPATVHRVVVNSAA